MVNAMSWMNSKRLRDYPRLILTSSTFVILLNVILNQGWVGGLTGLLIWADFIDYYGAGKLYINYVDQLYNPIAQVESQLDTLSPYKPQQFTFYSYPPNAALLHSGFTHLSLTLSIVIWCLISIGCVILSAYLINRYLLPQWLQRHQLSTVQLSILIFSCLAFSEGFAEGQMHSLTLLLMVASIVFILKGKWFLAGLVGAGLSYKPQYVIGFLLLYLI
jgi:hypothetical protein